MTAHLGPPGSAAPPVPEPSHAERARTLLEQGRTGMLSTLSRRHPGHPFGSIMPYALDEARPLFLISRLAMHTQNLEADSRTSLLVAETMDDEDPLALARVTVIGRASLVAPAERERARATYLSRQPRASNWVDFDDFAFWRLELTDVYWVGGFGAMGWLTPAEYAEARPDPLAAVATDVLQHMNDDHRDALITFARVLAHEDADDARMLAVDRLGFKLRLVHGERRSSCRIAFPREVTSAATCRETLIEMLRDCRSRA